MLARFVCIVPILIVPTTLMGSSLPLLSRHFVGHAEDAKTVSRRVGALYAVNTLGAVCGVLLAGFVLMPRFGMAAANRFAVGMNLALALAIFALRPRLAEHGATPVRAQASTAAAPESDALPFPARVRIAAAVAFALSGFCSLLYEVVWSRALVNTIGGSVYAFALILMTFLIGIALGSAAASRFVDDARAGGPAVIAGAALSLCVVAPLPYGVHIGPWAWFSGSAACAAAVLALRWCARGIRASAPGSRATRRAMKALPPRLRARRRSCCRCCRRCSRRSARP